MVRGTDELEVARRETHFASMTGWSYGSDDLIMIVPELTGLSRIEP